MIGLHLSERLRQVLKIVVEDYITSAEPVGSRAISAKSALNLSPASIRTVLAELEDLGLLYQPHTSAGRMPTEHGFRFYVDHILDLSELNPQEQKEIRTKCSLYQVAPSDLFREASRVLSATSHYLGVVWAPRMVLTVLQHIEFVRLKKHVVMAILVSSSGLVHNRVIEVEEDLAQSDLDRLSDYLNRALRGLTLRQVRERLLDEMKTAKSTYDRLMEQALLLGQQALDFSGPADLFIEGRTNILNEPEFASLARMSDLFRAFEEKATMVKLLDQFIAPRGIQVAIGSESRIEEMETCSLVTSTYSCNGEVLGVLGVIGPRRMNYSRVIPIVDYTAKRLTEILETP